jgi:NADH-quinone oxidoreductase subunit N
MALVAAVMVVAAVGFRVTAVPFHFYAPDVYEGAPAGVAALLAFLPKVAGFAALVRLLGLIGPDTRHLPFEASSQLPLLLWILAILTMTLGNVLALLQDNLRRLLAYSSVAHAGYMLIGLAVAPWLLRGAEAPGESVGGVEALLFYLMAYGAMTIGAFAVLHYLSTPDRPVENVDDLAGLGRSHPGAALVMVLFLFSLIGIPLTAGFAGKLLLFFDALGLRSRPSPPDPELAQQFAEQYRLYAILAVIGVINAAVGAWYYLRIAAVMYLREPLEPLPARPARPVLGTLALCAAVTLFLGIYANPVLRAVQSAVPRAHHPAPDRAVAEGAARR